MKPGPAPSPLRTLVRMKAAALVLLGPVAGGLSWFAATRLAEALARNDTEFASLPVPARIVIEAPLTAGIPCVAASVVALLALLSPRRGTVLLLLATLVLLAGVSLMGVTLLQVVGPLYEYRAI